MSSVVYIGAALVLVGIAFFAVPFAYRMHLAKELGADAVPFTQSPDDPRATVLVLGDSTGVGVGAARPSESVAGRLGRKISHAHIENCARVGARIADVSRQLTCATRETYDLIVLQVGANDALSREGVEAVAGELDALLATLTARARHTVFLSSGYIGDAAIFPFFARGLLNARTVELYERFAKVAEMHSRVYRVDLFDSEMRELFVREPEVYLASDRFHPSSAGYKLWFDCVREVLEKESVWHVLR